MTLAAAHVVVSETALEDAIAAASRAHPYETGGILVGVSTPDGVWITQMLEVRAVDRWRNAFTIPSGATHRVVDLLRNADSRLGYIGDWHSHPANAPASGRDLRTLAAIAVGVFRSTRLVAVLRFTEAGWELDFHRMGGLHVPQRTSYELGGPLGP